MGKLASQPVALNPDPEHPGAPLIDVPVLAGAALVGIGPGAGLALVKVIPKKAALEAHIEIREAVGAVPERPVQRVQVDVGSQPELESEKTCVYRIGHRGHDHAGVVQAVPGPRFVHTLRMDKLVGLVLVHAQL
ncbi:MAG TPA: hypothetical protein DCQ16_01470 [Spirochaetaceae bacterium]|nr:hypothetical protein [Spirochaetaceae bacterium]